MGDSGKSQDLHTPLLGDSVSLNIQPPSDDEEEFSPRDPMSKQPSSEGGQIRVLKRVPSRLNRQDTGDMGELQTDGSNIAFTIVVRRENEDGECDAEGRHVEEGEGERMEFGVTQEVVQEAVTDAMQEMMQDAMTDAMQGAVQEAVTEAVTDAVQHAIEDNVRLNLKANFYTFIAITGVILYWRGIWTMWDYLFGFQVWSEVAAIAVGLIIMITFRITGVPLLDGLPSG